MSDQETRAAERDDPWGHEAMRAMLRAGEAARLPLLGCPNCGWFGLPRLEWFAWKGSMADGDEVQLALAAYCHGTLAAESGKAKPSCGKKLRTVKAREPWTRYAPPAPDVDRVKAYGKVPFAPYDPETEVRRGDFLAEVLGDPGAARTTAWFREQAANGVRGSYSYFVPRAGGRRARTDRRPR